MSWIGGSLSSLTGQLTNLTKDILNEGTEEVVDPTAELQVAKEKLQQLDSQLTSLKHENDRLKQLNRELEEKAETSELQINAITSQYRALLEDKEKEINNLKHQHQELLEQHVRAELPDHHGDYEQQWTFNEHDFSAANDGSSGWDFDDSIKLQKENNRLRAELQHARSEVKHWRAASKHLGQGAGQSEDHQAAAGAEIVELQQKIKSLELQLASKTEELQQQATSLHEHHRQKVSTLRSRHQEEVNALQEKLSALRQQIEVNDGGNSSQHSGSGALAEADRVDGGGFHPLETDTAERGRKSGQAQQENGSTQDEDFVLLSRRLQESESTRRQLEKQLEQLKEELADAQGMLSDLRVLRECLNAEALSLGEKFRSERQSAVNQLFRVVQQKNSLTQSLVQAKDEQEKLVEQTEACIEELGEQNQQNFSLELFDSIEKENLTLKAEKLKYEEQITLLEKRVSTCSTDNQSLLQKIQSLQARLREYGDDHWDTDDTLDMTFTSHNSEHQGNSVPDIGSDEVDKELAKLRAQLNSHSQELANVEVERTDWMMEKDALEDVITELRQKAQSLDQELRSMKSGASVNSSASDEVQEKIQTLETQISSLQQENNELKNALEELDEQHAEAIDQVIQKRNQLAAQLSEKNAEIVQQQDTIDQLKKTITDLQESLSGSVKTNDSNSNHVAVWEEKCQQYESEIQDLGRRLSDALKANGAMEKEIADLKQKLHKGGQVINDLHMDKQELHEDLENARSETAAKVLKIKEMREDHKVLLGEKKGLEAQLVDMKERLSELEDELDKWQQLNETNQVEKLSGDQKAGECAELRCKLAAFEEQKKLFSFNFEHILSDQGADEGAKEANITDSAFQKILEKEANVRRQIESDGRVINSLRQQVDKLYNDKQKLKEQLRENESLQATVTDKLKQLEGEHNKTLTELETCQQIVAELQQRLSQEVDNRQSLSQALGKANVKVEEAMKLNEQTETEKLELSNQLESLMNHCEKLKNGQDSESILEENKKLLDTQRELTLKVERLEAEVAEKISAETVKNKDLKELELKFVTVQAEAANCVTKMNELQNVCAEKDKDIEQMKSHLVKLKESELQAELHLNEISDLREEIKRLKCQQDQWEKQLAPRDETITRLQQELAAAQEMIQCQEAGIADLNEKSEENRRALEKSVFDLTKHKSTIAVLRQTSVDKEELLTELESKLNFIVSVLTSEQIEMLRNFTRRPALEYEEVKAIEYSNISSDSSSETTASHSEQLDAWNKENSSRDEYIVEEIVENVDQEKYLEFEKEIESLQAELSVKDQKVTELQNSNAALLALFEKGAGDKSSGNQIDILKLENELRELRSEREQLMAVVTEKSREASSLKLETHKLVTALSASQAALGKLQEDNRDLHQRQSSHALDEEVDDMRREALANMARLVRDKETELEAIKQKNETLLAVLHASSETQAASHLAPLLKDKETLGQQIATLTSEREQLIACVTQKHAEAVAYHSETQRLSGLLAEVQAGYEKATSDYQALIPKFDDKAQALVAAQNELVQCKQRLSSMEVWHGELIQRSNSMDLPSRPDVSGFEVESLKQAEAALRQELCQRDEKIQSLGHRISTLEDELLSRDTECAHLKKQLENAKFQLTGLLSEIADLKADRVQIQNKNIAQDSEFSSLREACNKMTMEAKEKDGHISALRDQVATLTAVLHERQGEQGHISKLMKENHESVALTQRLQHERDQLSLLVEQRRQEYEGLRLEVSYYKDKELKISREVERLRHHLIETEESYTKEALEAEEREKDLRNKLAAAEEQAMLYHSKMEMASQDNVRQLEGLQYQLQTVCGQRDSAYMQLANIQEQCQQYATSLSNLQLVLEHFQKEKEAAVAAETDHLERECKALRLELEDKRRELSDTKDDLIEALEGLEAASRLSEQLDRKEEAVAALKEEVLLRERALEAAEAEIHKLNSSSEAKVDKTLMHNMVMTWLTSPDNNRSEIVHLIGHVLSFSEDDFHKIEMAQSKKSLLSGIFSRTPAKDLTPVKSTLSNQSFSQLFVKFLEKESSPPTSPVRLPAEAMAAEAQHRHKSPFNPFTAPRHATHDPQKSSSPSSHLLISNDVAPMPSALFTPISNSHASSESAILKDVLGKR